MHAERVESAAAARREAAARAARLGRPVLLSVSRPAPPADAVADFASACTGERGLWLRPAHGEAVIASGAVCAFQRWAAAELDAIGAAWRQLVEDAVVEDTVARPLSGPLLIGGLAFDSSRPPTSLWTGFPAVRFVLPRQLLVRSSGSSWLTTNELIGAPGPANGSPKSKTRVRPPPAAATADSWQALVGSIAHDIRSGQPGTECELEKVVLARAQYFESAHAFDVPGALRHLAGAYPSCTVFAIEHGDGTFLGATPERLVTLHKGIASSMALAASIRRGETAAEDDALARRLLDDPKERSEHAIVVAGLRDGLSRACVGVFADAQPRVERLANVQHLLTRVRGQVQAGRSVLDLVAALHPSPAVGGLPRDRALAVIRRREGLDRGWYAGALGWLNGAGEGEFVVGIRSALVRGSQAALFAGCGIVADSDPSAEYVESEWKLAPMLSALGLNLNSRGQARA